jgi:hypothetical protein
VREIDTTLGHGARGWPDPVHDERLHDHVDECEFP